MKAISSLNLLFLLLFFSVNLLVAENPKAHSDGDIVHSQSEDLVVRIPRMGRFTAQLKDLCTFLSSDGRDQLFKQVAETNSIPHADCPACRDFYRLLFKACSIESSSKKVRPKIKRKQKKQTGHDQVSAEEEEQKDKIEDQAQQEATLEPKPANKQRYPHIDVIQLIVSMVHEWRQDAFAQGYLQISQHFLKQLEKAANTKAAKEYVAIISEVWLSPLSDLIHDRKFSTGQDSELKHDEVDQAEIDQLFED